MMIIIFITVKNIDSMITIEIMRKKIIGNNSVDSFTRIFEKTNFLKERSISSNDNHNRHNKHNDDDNDRLK